MIVEACVLILVVPLLFVVLVRRKDVSLPQTAPVSYLEERRAAIYENLRDLLFEFRVGKLSEADYLATKSSLQKELTTIAPPTEPVDGSCSQCGAKFPRRMKFCGNCGRRLA